VRWTVVPAGPHHLPAIAALVDGAALMRRYGRDGAATAAALEAGLAAGDIALLACQEGDLLGLAWVVPTRALGNVAYLRLLLVADAHQTSGIGSALLRAAEDAAARAGARALILLVTTDNAGARRFYERAGYRHVGDLPGWARPGLDEALYEKRLRAGIDRCPTPA
jgi:GNAT superfamily N-acetyltransferase